MFLYKFTDFFFYFQCIVQSWSLSGDFHFFLVCLAICAVIKKNPKLGLSLLVGITALSVTMSFVILYLNRELPIIKYWPKSAKDLRLHPEFLNSYIRSHMRAAPYLLGAFAGYIYHELGTTRRELLTKVSVTALQNVSYLSRYSIYCLHPITRIVKSKHT